MAQSHVEHVVQSLVTKHPKALAQPPWRSVMVDLASKFPEAFKQLLMQLQQVDRDYLIPFVRSLRLSEFAQDGARQLGPSAFAPCRADHQHAASFLDLSCQASAVCQIASCTTSYSLN